jgi:DNA polymerase III epsilon subunit-like protein
MDNRIHYYLVLDTETTNGLDQPFVYDIGGVITDKQGRIYERFSFVVRDIFVYERALMQTAYYANKIPEYVEDIHNKKRIMMDFFEIRHYILNLMKKYNITDVAAYNAHFDRKALNLTQRWTTKSRSRYFFPYGTNFVCIWNMACDVLLNRATYIKFAEKNGLISEKDNIQTSAECAYRYIKKDLEFLESHTGLEDVKIEVEIMAECYRQKQKMEKGIYSACWRRVQKKRKEMELRAAFKAA